MEEHPRRRATRAAARSGLGVAILAAIALAALLTATDAAAGARSSLPRGRAFEHPGPDVLYAPAAHPPQLRNRGPWHAKPILVSGASSYRRGEFVYQDFLFDDAGALGTPDPADPHNSSNWLFAPRAGTITYPTDPVFHHGAADLVELRAKPLRRATAFRITLNALSDPDRSAATIALGSSPDSRPWPDRAGVSSPARLFLTWHGTEAELTDAATGKRLRPAPRVKVSLHRKQVELRVPHAAWNPGRGKVRIAAGTGLWDPGAGHYLVPAVGPASASSPGGAGEPGGPAIFNLAFRYDEPMPAYRDGVARTIGDAAAFAKLQARFWREKRQAVLLSRGDAGHFHDTIDFGKLLRRVRDDENVPRYGHFDRILASRFSFGQGQNHDDECGGIGGGSAVGCKGLFVGPLQPYGVYVPKPNPTTRAHGYGLTLLLHALSANQNQYLGSRQAAQFGERGKGSIVVTPSGRGPDGFYRGYAEADTFETWADVARHYELDPSFTAMGGISMGGIGSWRLAGRYPDLFARIVPTVAAASNPDLLPSLRNVPAMSWSSALDELQPIALTEATTQAAFDDGLRLDAWLFPTWDHLTPSTNDWYGPQARFLGNARVDRNPFHVTYTADPESDTPKAGVEADSAYWVTGMRALPGDGEAHIDALSQGFGRSDPAVAPVRTTHGTLSRGHHAPSPFVSRSQAWGKPGTAPKRDRLVLATDNLLSATIDTRRARLSCGPEIAASGEPVPRLNLACPTRHSRRCAGTLHIGLPRIDGAEEKSVTVSSRDRELARLKPGRRRAAINRPSLGSFPLSVRVETSGASPIGTLVAKRHYRACPRRR